MSLRFTRLTRPNIRALKAGDKITEHGITAERLASGDARYSVNVMVDGQRIHRVIGRESEGVTRSQCEEFIEAKRTEAREDRLSLPSKRKTPLTFAQAERAYLERLKETGGKNVPTKRHQLRLYLTPFFGTQRLDAITEFTVNRYKKRRQGQEAANGTINRELATLSHLFNEAVEAKWIKARPCRIKRLEESRGRITVLSEDDISVLLEAAIDDPDPYIWLFVVFGLNTAMRHREILRSRFDQLDIDNLRLFIPEAKAGVREQPITQELADILRVEREGREDQEGWIFPTLKPNLSEGGNRTHMGSAFKRAVIRAGLDPVKVTPHVMRHTAITNLVQAGVDLPTIKAISGHKTLAMVERYTHVHGPHIDHAIKALGLGFPGTVTQELHRKSDTA